MGATRRVFHLLQYHFVLDVCSGSKQPAAQGLSWAAFLMPTPSATRPNHCHLPTPVHPDFKSPSNVIDFDVLAEAFSHQRPSTSAAHPDTSSGPLVHVPNPTYDYVPPHLISLFVTDMGGYTPSYVYRLLAEFYDR